ncbi:MAG TPA: DUF559 domain-containing protein [Stellaceae bacterium]
MGRSERLRSKHREPPPPLRGRVGVGGLCMANAHARQLRSNLTDAEARLWRWLRRRQLGQRFRRQVPLSPYIADFVCMERRLVIEVDGGQHSTDVARDTRRTAWLEAQGFRVLRFWNNEVLGNTEGVLSTIAAALGERVPPPQPSPARGKGV